MRFLFGAAGARGQCAPAAPFRPLPEGVLASLVGRWYVGVYGTRPRGNPGRDSRT
jgi:hypothetical protein